MFYKHQQQQISFKTGNITNYITFPPANSLKTNRGGGGGGGAKDILQVQCLSIDGLNNSEDTAIQ